jgi:secreted trypsin-like serine protease
MISSSLSRLVRASAFAAAILAIACLADSASAAIRPHIVGGLTAAQGTFPYTAEVVIDATDENEQVICSGSVIAPSLVLTAGHCAYDPTTGTTWPASDYMVYTGSTTAYTGANTTYPGQSSGVKAVILDQLYKRLTTTGVSDWDASLLQLSTPTTVTPIAIATPTADAGLYDAGVSATVDGWGLTDGSDDDSLPSTLQWTSTSIEAQSGCGTAAGSLFDPADQLCASDAPQNSSGTCEGDSGGPLVANTSGGAVEIGVVSFGINGCDTSQPGFYTSVAAISSWLNSEIASTSAPGGTAALAPGATTLAATAVSASGATLNGTVTASGGDTSYYFEWGTTNGYGSATPSETTATSLRATAAISGINPAFTIHYRLVTSSQTGTSYGEDETFTTLSVPAAAAKAPKAPVARPARGMYRGLTAQRYQLSLKLDSNQRDVGAMSVEVKMSCTRHRGGLAFRLKPTGRELWPKRLKSALDFVSSFQDSKHWYYVVHATFTKAGAAKGTLSISGKNARYGSCKSGTVHWSATA